VTPTVIVLAKAPVPGRVKTRLCPPCDPEQAADLAAAALADTVDAVLAVGDVRPVLALDGEPGGWLSPAIEVLRQRGDGLDERLANAFTDVGSSAVLIGMDTPQITASHVEHALRRLDGADAVLAPSDDGGWWAIGLHAPDARVFLGVPMSTPWTHAAQLARLRRLGLRTAPLPALRDVDFFTDALAVAATAPGGRFAARVRAIAGDLDRGPAEAAIR
jgi:rSAM/selenodomain-associated transferase 1